MWSFNGNRPKCSKVVFNRSCPEILSAFDISSLMTWEPVFTRPFPHILAIFDFITIISAEAHVVKEKIDSFRILYCFGRTPSFDIVTLPQKTLLMVFKSSVFLIRSH